MQQIYRRTPMSKCDFNKVALQYWIRITFLKNISGGLLLGMDKANYQRPWLNKQWQKCLKVNSPDQSKAIVKTT